MPPLSITCTGFQSETLIAVKLPLAFSSVLLSQTSRRTASVKISEHQLSHGFSTSAIRCPVGALLRLRKRIDKITAPKLPREVL